MKNSNKPIVAVLMGSDSDLPVMQACIDQLKDFNIPAEVHVMSAHRTPQAAAEFGHNAAKNGIQIIIAAAGMAAHLAGAMAAHTHLPILGVPLAAKEGPAGMDALLSTVQMPPGMPVATLAIGKAGAKNAAVLTLQILALGEDKYRETLLKFREKQTQKVLQKDQELQKKLQQ